jgi:hypothetical protein
MTGPRLLHLVVRRRVDRGQRGVPLIRRYGHNWRTSYHPSPKCAHTPCTAKPRLSQLRLRLHRMPIRLDPRRERRDVHGPRMAPEERGRRGGRMRPGARSSGVADRWHVCDGRASWRVRSHRSVSRLVSATSRPSNTALSCKRRIDEAREARIKPPLVSCSASLCGRRRTLALLHHRDVLQDEAPAEAV